MTNLKFYKSAVFFPENTSCNSLFNTNFRLKSIEIPIKRKEFKLIKKYCLATIPEKPI